MPQQETVFLDSNAPDTSLSDHLQVEAFESDLSFPEGLQRDFRIALIAMAEVGWWQTTELSEQNESEMNLMIYQHLQLKEFENLLANPEFCKYIFGVVLIEQERIQFFKEVRNELFAISTGRDLKYFYANEHPALKLSNFLRLGGVYSGDEELQRNILQLIEEDCIPPLLQILKKVRSALE